MVSKSGDIELLAVGDIDERSPGTQFDQVRSILAQGDVTFGQMEFMLAGTERTTRVGDKSATNGPVKDPDKGAQVLASAGFDVMSCASNHTLDHGEQALLETIAAADRAGLRHIGVGRNVSDARKPVIFELEGRTIGFIGYCSVANNHGHDPWATADQAGAAPLRAFSSEQPVGDAARDRANFLQRNATEAVPEDLNAMIEDIQALRREVDIVVVSEHWGVYKVSGPVSKFRISSAHVAIDAGADVVLGHHPHLIEAIEFYKGAPIFYGLPNFCLPIRGRDGLFIGADGYDDGQLTFIAKVSFSGTNVSRVALIPCYLYNATGSADNRGYTTEPLKQQDPRSEQVRKFLESTDNYFRAELLPEGVPPVGTKYSFDGDEILVEAESV